MMTPCFETTVYYSTFPVCPGILKVPHARQPLVGIEQTTSPES